MSEPSEKNRESDLPFIWHESEFDVAADLGCKDAMPTGEFTRGEYIHHFTEFDCSERVQENGAVALRLTFHLQAGEASPSLARDISELLHALHEYDKALGGKGLGLDRAAGRAGEGWLSVVLRPNEPEPGEKPSSLEEEIAALIRSAWTRERQPSEPDDDSWVPADEADPSSKTVAVEARLFYAIDQIAAQNRQRVEERGQVSASTPVAQDANKPGGAAKVPLSHLGDLEEQIRRALQRCHSHNIHLTAEVIDVSHLATAQPSHETGGEE
jgi:hypothetical protein